MIKAIGNNKLLYLFFTVMLGFIILGITVSHIFTLAALGMFLLMSLFASTSDTLSVFVGLLPFASIFRFSPTSTSLFTIIELYLVLLMFYKRRSVNKWALMSALLLLGYMIALSPDTFEPLLIVKVFAGFVFISLAITFISKNDVLNSAVMLSFSLLVSMLLSFSNRFTNYLLPYFDDINYYVDATGKVTNTLRLSGFLGDPNYFSVLIIVTVTLLSLLYYYRRIGFSFWVFFFTLIPMGFFTYSKSYFLTVAAFCVALFFTVLIQKHKKWAVFFLLIMVVALIVVLVGNVGVIEMTLDRFANGDLTTGRDDLNNDYINYIFSEFRILLFGDGIASDRFEGASNNVHNFYIEILYKLGLVGAVIYVLAVIMSTRKKNEGRLKRNSAVHYLPALFMAVMFFFLAGITRYELPVYILICTLAVKYRTLNEEKETDGLISASR